MDNNISYKINSTILIPFLITCCVLSIILPIHSDNTYFYLSGVSFIVATLMIPLSQILTTKVSGLRKKIKVYRIIEWIHSLTLIAAIIFFLLWFFELSNQ